MKSAFVRFCSCFLFVFSLSVFLGVQSSSQDVGLSIRITQAPPLGEGGPNEMGSLKARVSDPQGVCGRNFERCRVALFTNSDAWYPQPFLVRQLVEVREGGLVDEEVHLGRRYAAMVVFPDKYKMQPEKFLSLPINFALAIDELEAGKSRPDAQPAPIAPAPSVSAVPVTTPSTAQAVNPQPSPSQPRFEWIDDLFSKPIWVAIFVVLLLSLLLNVTEKVEIVVSAVEGFLSRLLNNFYSAISELRDGLETKLKKETDTTISDGSAGVFFFVVAIGAAVANFGVVKFSLEVFLPITDNHILEVLVAVYVAAKACAGWMWHRLNSDEKGNKINRRIVVGLLVLACLLDALITYKRASLTDEMNGVVQVTTAFGIITGNPVTITAFNVITSSLEVALTYWAFDLATKPLNWILCLPVYLPALIFDGVLDAAGATNKDEKEKTGLAKLLAVLLFAVLTVPKTVAVHIWGMLQKLFSTVMAGIKRIPDMPRTLIAQRRKWWISRQRYKGVLNRVALREAKKTLKLLDDKHSLAVDPLAKAKGDGNRIDLNGLNPRVGFKKEPAEAPSKSEASSRDEDGQRQARL